MTAPTAPIDSSLPPEGREIFYVLEDASIWKTENLVASGAGVATWTESYTVALFESENGVTDGHFLRIIAASDTLVYVLGYATLDGSSYPYMLRSQNGGLTWAAFKVDDTALTLKDYTVKSSPATHYSSVGLPTPLDEYLATARVDEGQTVAPWALGFTWSGNSGDGGPPGGWTAAITIDPTNSPAGTNFYEGAAGSQTSTQGNWGTKNSLLSAGDQVIAAGYLTDYFGSYSSFGTAGASNMPKDDARVNFGFTLSFLGFGNPAGETIYWDWQVFSFYNVPSVSMPKAFDVAKQNTSWLYVGLNDKIRASEDGAQTWFDFTTSATGNGANDVHVDPQIPGAVYVWSDDGKLNLWLKNTLGSVGSLNQTAIMTETANEDFLRIARDLNSGKLWAIPNGTTITRRENLANVDQKTGLTGGQGLHAYTGGYLIMVDNTNIYISNDYGVTWTAKTGDWATYSNGNNAHRIKSAT